MPRVRPSRRLRRLVPVKQGRWYAYFRANFPAVQDRHFCMGVEAFMKQISECFRQAAVFDWSPNPWNFSTTNFLEVRRLPKTAGCL